MKYLQANDYTKVSVGLKTAPNLIRQKASFGTELSDQAHELARILVGLQDTFEMEQFQELRHAALIALVASSPEVVTSYLISVYFTGDISIQQRLVLLSALGIGARELAGHEKIVPSPCAIRLTLGTHSATTITFLVTSPIPLPHGPSLTTTRSNNDRTHQTSRRTKSIRTTGPSNPPFHHRTHIPQSQTQY